MGQIKNIKLHIVTDIKDNIFKGKTPHTQHASHTFTISIKES